MITYGRGIEVFASPVVGLPKDTVITADISFLLPSPVWLFDMMNGIFMGNVTIATSTRAAGVKDLRRCWNRDLGEILWKN